MGVVAVAVLFVVSVMLMLSGLVSEWALFCELSMFCINMVLYRRYNEVLSLSVHYLICLSVSVEFDLATQEFPLGGREGG